MTTIESKLNIPLPPDIPPDRINDLDAWFPRAPEATAVPALPQTLAVAHDALMADYDAKRAAAEAKQARWVRWWQQ
jgi:hypothetical protein